MGAIVHSSFTRLRKNVQISYECLSVERGNSSYAQGLVETVSAMSSLDTHALVAQASSGVVMPKIGTASISSFPTAFWPGKPVDRVDRVTSFQIFAPAVTCPETSVIHGQVRVLLVVDINT